jgi:hypothetical protein
VAEGGIGGRPRASVAGQLRTGAGWCLTGSGPFPLECPSREKQGSCLRPATARGKFLKNSGSGRLSLPVPPSL